MSALAFREVHERLSKGRRFWWVWALWGSADGAAPEGGNQWENAPRGQRNSGQPCARITGRLRSSSWTGAPARAPTSNVGRPTLDVDANAGEQCERVRASALEHVRRSAGRDSPERGDAICIASFGPLVGAAQPRAPSFGRPEGMAQSCAPSFGRPEAMAQSCAAPFGRLEGIAQCARRPPPGSRLPERPAVRCGVTGRARLVPGTDWTTPARARRQDHHRHRTRLVRQSAKRELREDDEPRAWPDGGVEEGQLIP